MGNYYQNLKNKEMWRECVVFQDWKEVRQTWLSDGRDNKTFHYIILYYIILYV
jgi:hypothetical protein